MSFNLAISPVSMRYQPCAASCWTCSPSPECWGPLAHPPPCCHCGLDYSASRISCPGRNTWSIARGITCYHGYPMKTHIAAISDNFFELLSTQLKSSKCPWYICSNQTGTLGEKLNNAVWISKITFQNVVGRSTTHQWPPLPSWSF